MLAALATAGSTPAHAQTSSRLAALELGLSSDDAAERSVALDAYAALADGDVGEIADRLRALRRRGPDPIETTRALTAFRHAVGSRRADDAVDLAPGIAPTLAEARDRETVRIAAAILLERAAERVATTEALGAVVEIAAWGGDGMRLEARRIAVRLGARLAPVVIAARSHDEREARQWAEWAGARLGLDAPGRFVAGLEADLIPDVLLALARGHVLSAVPVAVSFVDAPRSSTREAAREALTLYGQNSIWVARDAYRIRTGEPPDLDWGWRRTLDALFAAIDAAHEEVLAGDLARANAALEGGDRETASQVLEAALRRVPAPAATTLGDAMLRLAELDVGADDLEAARRHAGVARRIPLAAGEEPRLRALISLVSAEARLGAGVLDGDGYARAAIADPTCSRCAELHARFEEHDDASVGTGAWPLWLSAAAFLVLALLLWPSRRVTGSQLGGPTAADDAPGDAADATLPG